MRCTAGGNKLLCSPVVQQQILQYRLLDSSRVNRLLLCPFPLTLSFFYLFNPTKTHSNASYSIECRDENKVEVLISDSSFWGQR